MDINKAYRNPKLEFRRQQLIERERADAALRQSKSKAVKPRAEVLAAMKGEAVGALGSGLLHIHQIKEMVRCGSTAECEQLFLAIADRSALLDSENYNRYLRPIARLHEYRAQWVRKPGQWRPGTHNVGRQFSSLARHLLCRFSVPGFFDEAWLADGTEQQRGWFVHVGQGGNLRKADHLPFALTKMMAHHIMVDSPTGVSLMQAIRYGQCRGVGMNQRLTLAVLGSRIGNEFFGAEAEAFWATVLGFFAQHPMIDPHQIGPIVDYLHHQRFAEAPPQLVNGTFMGSPVTQPNLTMRGRDPETLVRQVQAWHRGLVRRSQSLGDFAWAPCGINGYDRIEGEAGNQRRFTISELLSSDQLREEGRAMSHCVSTYGWSCKSGRAAIFSMKVMDRMGERRLITIEVDLRQLQIVQARGRFNAQANQLDQRVLSAWATVAGLKIGKYALAR